MPKRLLLVDDEKDILEELASFLQNVGYSIETAANGHDALKLCKSRHFDLMILDVNMPGIDGLEVLRTLRENKNEIPVIMLTNRTKQVDRIGIYGAGADDYIGKPDYLDKPFGGHELIVRIEAKLRPRPISTEPHRFTCGELMVNRIERKIWLEGKEVQFTPRAFDILAKLMQNAPNVVTQHELRGEQYDIDTNAVRQRIAELRKILGNKYDLIETVVGEGYRFCGEVRTE